MNVEPPSSQQTEEIHDDERSPTYSAETTEEHISDKKKGKRRAL